MTKAQMIAALADSPDDAVIQLEIDGENRDVIAVLRMMAEGQVLYVAIVADSLDD